MIRMMKNNTKGIVILAFALLSAATITGCGSKEETPLPPYVPPVITPVEVVDKGWTFETTPTWSDEFDYTGAPATARWDYDLGGHGWGNNEKQNYTSVSGPSGNVNVADGKLTITARKESSGGMNYSSTRLVSRGKLDILYGRIEISAKLPTGKGTWPALWMLPTDRSYGDWPKSGEIDIMEHVGYDQNTVHFSVHTEAYNHGIGTQKTATRQIPTASSAFNLYRVDWTPYAVRGYFNNEKVFEFVNEATTYKAWPFDKRFHLLLNVAVGGNWGGAQGIDDTVFPQKMEVEYVRYFKMIEK